MKKSRIILALVVIFVISAAALVFFGKHRHHRYAPWYVGLDDVTVERDIRYAPAGPEPSHRMDLVVPTNVSAPVPVIVWIHGGAWFTGDKLGCPGAPIVKNGFACASINYRFSQQAVFPAQINDCKAALRWLRANAKRYNLDPNRIGVWGQSAGGHLVALLGTTCGVKELEGDEGHLEYSSCVQAVCDWCGPTDLVSITSECGPDWGMDLTSPRAPQFRLVGGQDKEKLRAASPMAYVKAGAPPFLIMHGSLDNVVPPAQSVHLYDALKKAGDDAQYVVIEDGGHSFGDDGCVRTVIDFFKHKLGP